MNSRSYVLYAIRKTLETGEFSSHSFLEAIANAPDDYFSIAWALLCLQGHTQLSDSALDILRRQIEKKYFPSGLGFPIWFYNGSFVTDLSLTELDSEGATIDRKFSSEISWLDDQSQVELLLAISGHKVSRLTLCLHDIMRLQRLTRVPFICGSEVVNTVYDSSIHSFSNLADRKLLEYDSDPFRTLNNNKLHLDVYIATNWRMAALCWALDKNNKAGRLLGIPECCNRWFAENWEHCVNHYEGDMAFLCVKPELKSSKIEISASGNAYSMYKGGGLISHFPCHTGCNATKKIFECRAPLIEKYSPELFARVIRRHFEKFWVSSERRLSTASPDPASGDWFAIEPQ